VNHSPEEEEEWNEIVAEDRWDHEAILFRAKYEGVRIREYLVSGPQGDPFYVGQPAHREAVEWLTALWPRLGYGTSQRVHDRRMHYRIMSLSAPAVTLPDGTPYDTAHGEKCWLYLQHACQWARYLKEIDFSQIEDRRNPAAMGSGWQEEATTDPNVTVYGTRPMSPLEYVAFPEPPEYDIAGLTSRQRYHLEVWAEKTTMNDILAPWCEHHHAWLVTASGEMTVSGAYDAVRRMPIWERITQLATAIGTDLEERIEDIVAEVELPEPEEADEEELDAALFNSARDYVTQLQSYRLYQREHITDDGDDGGDDDAGNEDA
jgi:hypothetical protein